MINDALMIDEIHHSVRSYFEDRAPVIKYLRTDMNLGDLVFKNFTRLGKDDLKRILSWRNDDRIRQWMVSEQLISWEDHKRFIEKLKSDQNSFYYLVSVHGKPTGVIYLNRLDVRNKCGYWGIYKNQDETDRNAIHMVETAFLTILFEFLGLNTIKLEVMENNHRAIRFYEQYGFVREGILRNSIIRNGVCQNMIVMGLLKDDFLRMREHGSV